MRPGMGASVVGDRGYVLGDYGSRTGFLSNGGWGREACAWFAVLTFPYLIGSYGDGRGVYAVYAPG
jgi:hypothetical protein